MIGRSANNDGLSYIDLDFEGAILGMIVRKDDFERGIGLGKGAFDSLADEPLLVESSDGEGEKRFGGGGGHLRAENYSMFSVQTIGASF